MITLNVGKRETGLKPIFLDSAILELIEFNVVNFKRRA